MFDAPLPKSQLLSCVWPTLLPHCGQAYCVRCICFQLLTAKFLQNLSRKACGLLCLPDGLFSHVARLRRSHRIVTQRQAKCQARTRHQWLCRGRARQRMIYGPSALTIRYSIFVAQEAVLAGWARWVRGMAKKAATARRARVGSTKMLPSGPVVPPESRGCPMEWEASRW